MAISREKNQMTEEAQNIIKTIKQMEASLEDDKHNAGYDLDTTSLRVTYPLTDCLRDLKEKYNTVSRLHRERFEQVKKLVQALESYSSHLESSFVKIRLPPTSSNSCPPNFDLSPSYVTKLDEEFTRVYDEYNKRIKLVQTTAEEIVRLWSELGIPQAQTDSAIVQHYRDSPEQLGLHQADMERLKARRDKLVDEKKGREKRLEQTKASVEGLWDRLGVDEQDRKAFVAANRGCGLRTINEYEEELNRLNELKRQNMHLFVEDARVRLQELWDCLYFSEEEMLDFTPAFSDVYSDALLSAHEAEIERLQTLKEQRAPILAVIDKHRSLIEDRESLAASANDASRLMLRGQKGERRDPTRLLREEKMRKRIAKELPKVTAELVKTLEKYEEEYGRPFLVKGDRYLDEIAAAEAKVPPPRAKTPSSLPPRSKTPAGPPAASKPAPASTVRSAPPPRPGSVMKGPLSRPAAETPATHNGTLRRNPLASTVSAAPASHVRSPSKIPSRVPLGNLQYGNNSPERRMHSPPKHNPQQNHAYTAKTMGPPRVPPPKMRDLFSQPPSQPSTNSHANAPPPRPASANSSSDSQNSGRYVRPVSPEDVYDDRERMSYMSASLLQRDQNAVYQNNHHDFDSSMHRYAPSASNTSQMPSRQISNSSSNLTTGTTASGSENWESYSDNGSELEPERDLRDPYYAKTHATGGKRLPGGYAQMAPPAKMRMHNRIDEGRENARMVRVEGSDAAWSTEASETY
jgi:Ase1/PRC1/MAP65 family protein